MKKGKFKSNFLFIVGISIIVIILFSVGFATFYKDSSLVFNSDGYIISATENSSDSYSFASGTKYKTNLSNDIAFEDTNNKSVSVDSASFVHYSDGSLSFLQNGALIDLDKVNEDYVPYYNISNKFMINYNDGKYNITNNTKSLDFINWIGRISDDKYIVVGKNLGLKIPGVNKTIEGDYFELLFMTDGVVKIDNQDVSYQVTAQGSSISIGDTINIDLGENQIYYNNESKLLLSQITISGDENINLDDESGGGGAGGSGDGSGTTSGTSGTGSGTGSGNGGGSGTTSGVVSGTITSGAVTSGALTSGTSGTAGEGGAGGAGGEGEGDGEGDGTGGGGGDSGENTTASATIELIKLDTTSTSMHATLQMNQSALIGGQLMAYLTNIATGDRVGEGIVISKKDGTLAICSQGTECYSFEASMYPDSQYLLSIIDINNNRQYFQKLITTAELGVSLERLYMTDISLSYAVNFSTNSNVSQVDLFVEDGQGNEVKRDVGITSSNRVNGVVFGGLNPNTTYKIIMKNVSVCDADGNCSVNDEYESSRFDTTLKSPPDIKNIAVNKNVDSATFDLSATVKDDFKTIKKYIYTICEQVSKDEELTEDKCFEKIKTDGDPLNIKVGEDIDAGINYIYTFKVQYNDGQMDRELSSPQSKMFSMDTLPYFDMKDEVATANSITGKLFLIDPSCTVPIKGRVCSDNKFSKLPDFKYEDFTFVYYKLVDGEEEGKIEYKVGRDKIYLDDETKNKENPTNLYYHEFKLDDLAAETKYVIKMYGTYYFNGERRYNRQIGDELYFETASTGNLKFNYVSNVSNDENIINYNAGFSSAGGSEDEEALSALGTIERLTFDLYAGSYVSESSKPIGSYVITGNESIRKNFCNAADATSDVCNSSFNFNNVLFEIGAIGENNLNALLSATASKNNFCGEGVKSCLATAYTVVVKGYNEVDDGSPIKIDNNTYTYNVTPSYYVTSQLKIHNTTAIEVKDVTKVNFKDEDGKYDFNPILENLDAEEITLDDKDAFEKKFSDLYDSTVVGITVKTNIPKDYIDAVYKYYTYSIDYYICDINDTNCEKPIRTGGLNVDATYFTPSSSYTFYLDDSDFVRGKNYFIKYELAFTSDSGKSVYSSEKTLVSKYGIKRQAPSYTFYITKSEKNTITYNYRINRDIDNAIDPNEYYFYYSVDNGQDIFFDDNTKFEISKTEQDFSMKSVTFKLCEESCNGTNYKIYMKEKLIGDSSGYVEIENTIFDGFYKEGTNDNFELITFTNDNRLYVKLNDNLLNDKYDDELGDRTILYNLKLIGENSTSIWNRVYVASMLDKCDTEGTNPSIVCTNYPGNYKYITVDYAKIASSMGKKISVSVDSYYDKGLVGIAFKPIGTDYYGFILHNSKQNKYLNIYLSNNSGIIKPVFYEENVSTVVYKSTNTDQIIGGTIGDKVTLYDVLGLTDQTKKKYSNQVGANFVNNSNLSYTHSISYLSNGIKLGNYSNYDPKIVGVSALKTENSVFQFDSIIPRVVVTENKGINSIDVNLKLDGVSEQTLVDQFKNEDGYYLYVDLYEDESKTKLVSNKKIKILIDDNGNAYSNVEFKNLKIKTEYFYVISASMKNVDNDGNVNYTMVQVFDGAVENMNDYVAKTYKTSTLNEEELLSDVGFSARAVAYKNNDDSISEKKLSYNIKLSNAKNVEIVLGLFDKDGNQFDLNLTNNTCTDDSIDNGCYLILDSVSESAFTGSQLFNNNSYVFGDDYYTLKVYAVPYYSEDGDGYVKGYNEDKKLVLYDKTLVSTDNSKIDVHELVQASFSTTVSSGRDVDGNNGYYIKYKINSVSDKDFVMKNGEFSVIITKSGDSNPLYTVKNVDGVAVMYDSSNNPVSGDYIKAGTKLVYNANGIEILFPNLLQDTEYVITPSYETYRNNASLTDFEKTEVSIKSDYVYTPVGGVVFGVGTIRKINDSVFSINYSGCSNITSIKQIKYTITRNTDSAIISKTLVNKSNVDNYFAFNGNNSDYSLTIDVGSDFFKSSGLYTVQINYYIDGLSSPVQKTYRFNV